MKRREEEGVNNVVIGLWSSGKKKILWSDESWYMIWHSDWRVWTWGIPSEWYLPERVVLAVKFGGA